MVRLNDGTLVPLILNYSIFFFSKKYSMYSNHILAKTLCRLKNLGIITTTNI